MQKLDESLDSDTAFADRILGGRDFVKQILRKESIEHGQPSLDRLITAVAGYYGLKTEDLIYPNKERKTVQAKSVICYIAIRHYRQPGIEVARNLGYSTSAASHATKRGREIFGEDEALQRHIDRICK